MSENIWRTQMTMDRRKALLCAGGAVSMMAGLPASAQADFPARPVRIVDGYFTPTAKIGHGLEFDRAHLKRHAVT